MPDLLSIISKIYIVSIRLFSNLNVAAANKPWGAGRASKVELPIYNSISNQFFHKRTFVYFICFFQAYFFKNIPLNKNNPFLVDRASYIFLFAISCDRTFNLSTSQVLFWPFVPDNVFLIGQPFFYLTTFLGSGILQSGTFGAPELWCLGTKTLVPQMILTVLFC